MAVHLDYQLIYEARHLMSGADVHRLREMIFAYEQTVDLHNRQWPGCQTYQRQHEVRLRSYVVQRRLEQLEQQITAAREYCAELSAISCRLQERSEALHADYEDWKVRESA